MKNITLAIDENVLRAVRKKAAEKDTTVNALVREYLTHLAGEDERIAQARREIVEMSRKSKARIGPKTWTREDLYDRSL